MANEWMDQFRAVRRTSTPLVVLQTPDAAAAVSRLVDVLGQEAEPAPVVQWDVVRGIQPLNDAGAAVLARLVQGGSGGDVASPVEAARLLAQAPRRTAAFFLQPHAYWNTDPALRQAVWNLRDIFKQDRRTWIGVVPVGEVVPRELEYDTTIVAELMPDLADLSEIVRKLAGERLGLDAEQVERTASALAGLSAFTAEQCLAMAMRASGVDFAVLAEFKRRLIEQTPGLSVVATGETADDLAGLSEIKREFLALEHAREPVNLVVWIDEGDKAFAGAGGEGQMQESSGTKGDQLQVVLTEIDGAGRSPQLGAMLLGHPGTGKSAFARALAAMLGVPGLRLDLGALLDQYVGQSQARARQALAVIRALSGGRALWIMTCNSLMNLPAELRRRFDSMDMWFFDLPSAEERAAIWRLYLDRWGLPTGKGAPLPASLRAGGFDDADWTGAEIRKCAYRAYNLRLPLDRAAASIVPLALSDAAGVQRRRTEASGRFRDPSRPGVYRSPAGARSPQAANPNIRDLALGAAVVAATESAPKN